MRGGLAHGKDEHHLVGIGNDNVLKGGVPRSWPEAAQLCLTRQDLFDHTSTWPGGSPADTVAGGDQVGEEPFLLELPPDCAGDGAVSILDPMSPTAGLEHDPGSEFRQ